MIANSSPCDRKSWIFVVDAESVSPAFDRLTHANPPPSTGKKATHNLASCGISLRFHSRAPTDANGPAGRLQEGTLMPCLRLLVFLCLLLVILLPGSRGLVLRSAQLCPGMLGRVIQDVSRVREGRKPTPTESTCVFLSQLYAAARSCRCASSGLESTSRIKLHM